MNTTTTSPDPDEDQQFPRQTDDAVSQIAEEFNRASRSLILMGKTIKDYITQTDGIEGDAFKRLANHPKIPVGPTSLRAYLASYELWVAIAESETPPQVCPTAYGVVAQAAGLKPAEKARLLKAAQEQNWSVAELRRQVKEARKPSPPTAGNAKEDQDGITTGWNATVLEFNNNLKELIPLLTSITLTAEKSAVCDEVRKNCRHFVRLVLAQRIIERQWILDLLPDAPNGEGA